MSKESISLIPLRARGAFAVTGAASGIGAATTARLIAGGHNVITVDLHDAEVTCDLGTVEGRRHAVERISELSGNVLSGLVTCAGVDTSRSLPGSRVVSINYFGTVALLEGLRPALARAGDAAVVCVGSSSATVIPDTPAELLQLCLAGEERRAGELADETGAALSYGASKAAVNLYVRHNAVKREWIGAGIRMNAVAPGFIDTPLLGEHRNGPESGQVLETFRDATPAGRFGKPEEVAALIDFLLGPESGFMCGSVVFADGGLDAKFRADHWLAVWNRPARRVRPAAQDLTRGAA